MSITLKPINFHQTMEKLKNGDIWLKNYMFIFLLSLILHISGFAYALAIWTWNTVLFW